MSAELQFDLFGTASPEPLAIEEIIEEVEWLLDYRTHPHHIARSLHTNVGALEKRLRRAGRADLAANFQAARDRLRHD